MSYHDGGGEEERKSSGAFLAMLFSLERRARLKTTLEGHIEVFTIRSTVYSNQSLDLNSYSMYRVLKPLLPVHMIFKTLILPRELQIFVWASVCLSSITRFRSGLLREMEEFHITLLLVVDHKWFPPCISNYRPIKVET